MATPLLLGTYHFRSPNLILASKARNLSTSVLHFRMDLSVSVPFCKSALRALYTLANSSRSEPLVDSSARNASSVRFAGLGVHHSASTITVRW
jgi:hypothetical protein